MKLRLLAVRSARRGWIGLTVAMAIGLIGCSKDAGYTYVDVHVTIDPETVPSTRLSLVTDCEVLVMGDADALPFNLPCRENKVPYDMGTFQWTTQVKTGTLQFVVRILDASMTVIGEGTNDPQVVASPGKHLQTAVQVIGIAPTNNGGTTDASTDAVDGAAAQDLSDDLTDAGADRDASDAETGMTVDGSSDAAASADAGLD